MQESISLEIIHLAELFFSPEILYLLNNIPVLYLSSLLRGKSFSVSLLTMMLPVGLSYVAFIMLRTFLPYLVC